MIEETGDKWTLQWMQSIVNSIKANECRYIESSCHVNVLRLSVSLICEYTKSRLIDPCRLSGCHHAYCIERQVIETIGECLCGQTMKDPQNKIINVVYIRQIIEYLDAHQLDSKEIIVMFDFKCFFPLVKGKTSFLPLKMVHTILLKHFQYQENLFVWKCEHKQCKVNLEQTLEGLQMGQCPCGLNALVPVRQRIKLKLN